MSKRLLLLIAAVCVFCFATPSQATFWNNDRDNDRSNFWDNWDNKDWSDFEWPDFDWPKNDWPDFEWPDKQWPDFDWPKEHDCNRWCGCKDNPVPEPATAGLAFMGLAALGFAVRRRR